MQNENRFIPILLYSSKCRSSFCYNETQNILRTCLKRLNTKLFLICLLISVIYFILYTNSTSNYSQQIQFKLNKTKINAFIITDNCNSLRFRTTKENIERTFPEFFQISCYLFVSLNDSRIDPEPVSLLKRFSSNLLTFLDLWTYVIPKQSKNEFQWTFIFEDNVNFIKATDIFLPDFITPLKELMYNREIQYKHGFLYLGICEPLFNNYTQSFISNNTLLSHKGCGFCLHATGITTNRSRLFWTEISSYRPNMDGSLDKQIQDYCLRSKNYFYTFGSNFEYPPNTGHRGIAYQDRGRFSSTIT